MLGRGGKAKVGLGSESNPVSKASVALTRTVKRVAHRCATKNLILIALR
jgi:hypothetical protein